MTEDELLDLVTGRADQYDIFWDHKDDSRRVRGNRRGRLDLFLVGRRGVLWRELKTQTGTLSFAETSWILRLREAGADAGVWRPEDWPGRIDFELRSIN